MNLADVVSMRVGQEDVLDIRGFVAEFVESSPELFEAILTVHPCVDENRLIGVDEVRRHVPRWLLDVKFEAVDLLFAALGRLVRP